jgi:hypothetical protein
MHDQEYSLDQSIEGKIMLCFVGTHTDVFRNNLFVSLHGNNTIFVLVCGTHHVYLLLHKKFFFFGELTQC